MSFQLSDYTWPAYMGRKPYAHQRTTVEFLIRNRRAFVLNDMGTGKTLSALWACDILMTAHKIHRVLIICPLSTMGSVWYNEIMMNMPHRRVVIAHGPKAQRIEYIKNAAYEFVIINHDGPKIVEDEIIRQNFDIIIIDELTAYKSGQSDRSKCVKRICDRVKCVWGMTGDITPNAPTEAWYPAQIVNPFNQWLPKFFGQFRDACMTQINEYVSVAKPEAPQIVAMCVQPAIRFTRDQCLDLPDTSYQVIDVPLTPEQALHYNRMKAAACLDFDETTVTAGSAAIMLNKLLQISAGAVKDDTGNVIEIGCKDRLDELHRIFEETPQHKLLVFATYRATIELVVRDMRKRGVRVDTINGDVSQKMRSKLIDDFQRGDLQMLVVQPQSAAHGITLTAASTVVWFSLIPSNEYFQQGNARIVRAGQTRKTLIIMFVSTPAEKHIARMLKARANLSVEILKLFADRDL